jgi:hypothetical protein
MPGFYHHPDEIRARNFRIILPRPNWHLPERLQIFEILSLFQKCNGIILISFAMRNVFLSLTGSGRSTIDGKEITHEGQ